MSGKNDLRIQNFRWTVYYFIVQELLDILPQSYYYFSRVLEEYPESSWAYDAQEKMIRIEKLTPVYVQILKSLKNEIRQTG
ncbi:MAG: hypothetical protein JXB88_26490 [Spirochaetales bacterium]|nr:hypothetical protein [Spirochaetales bacterium]